MEKTAIVAIAAILIMEVTAIVCGLNGTVLAGAIAAVSGLGGYVIAMKRYKH